MNLVNKVALVTGASSGIGAAIAIKLTEEGARVAIVGRNVNKIQKVADTCEKQGGKPLIIIADVCKDDDVKRIITETINFFGKLDVLVNNAGIGDIASITEDKAMDVFDKVMRTNLRSAVHLTHLAVPHLVETKGNIVNISSVASKAVILRNHFSYGASKAALDHFTKSCALELAPKGIRVNAVNPGPVKTDIVENLGLNDAETSRLWDMLKNGTILNRLADPEEIADLVAFLASNKGRSITGSTILTDNGSIFLTPWDK